MKISPMLPNQNARRVFTATTPATLLPSTPGLGRTVRLFVGRAADALDDIAKAGAKIRIGVFEDYPPFGSIGPDIEADGLRHRRRQPHRQGAPAPRSNLIQVTGDNHMAYLADHKADMLLSVGQTLPGREKGDRFLAALRALPRRLRSRKRCP